MTREEAIRHIRDVIAENNSIKPNIVTFEQEKEALYIAIEALSADTIQIEKYHELQHQFVMLGATFADLTEVVRCKDCRHCSEHYDRNGYPYWICDEWDSGTDADGFCHYGERRKK